MDPFLKLLSTNQLGQRVPFTVPVAHEIGDIATIAVRTRKRNEIACLYLAVGLFREPAENAGGRCPVLRVECRRSPRSEHRLDRYACAFWNGKAVPDHITNLVFIHALVYGHY